MDVYVYGNYFALILYVYVKYFERLRRFRFFNIHWSSLVNDSLVVPKKVTHRQLWGILYRMFLFNLTHKDLGMDSLNIFPTIVSVGHNGKS